MAVEWAASGVQANAIGPGYMLTDMNEALVNNPEFNFAQPVKGQENEKAFEKPEVLVRMKCDVHAWMFAYIGVVDHPYFAVTDKDGSFKISNLPAGEYTIEAFHQKIGKMGAKSQKIKVSDSDKKTVDFELEVPAP